VLLVKTTGRLTILVLAMLARQERPQTQVSNSKKESKMPDKIDQATTSLREFIKTRDVEAIEKAVDSLEEFDIWSLKPDQRLEARRRLLLNWSRVLRDIDSVKQPGFDPEADPPIARAAPPGSPSLVDQRKKVAHHRTQVLVIELEERAVESAHRVVERLYTKSAADQKEMEAAFKEGGLSEARRAQVLAAPKKAPVVAPPPEPDED